MRERSREAVGVFAAALAIPRPAGRCATTKLGKTALESKLSRSFPHLLFWPYGSKPAGRIKNPNGTHYYNKARFELKSRKVRSIPDRAIGSIAEGAGGHVSRKMFAADGLHPAAGSACVARAHATTMQRYVARKIFAADGFHLRAGEACAPASMMQRYVAAGSIVENAGGRVSRKIFAADGFHLRAGIACAPVTGIQRYVGAKEGRQWVRKRHWAL